MRIKKTSVSSAGGHLTLSAPVSFQGKETTCFYSVPEQYADLADTASSNCFLVGFLYPAMRTGEDIHVEGTVSARLLYNLNEYLIPFMAMCDSRLKAVKVTADATDDEGCRAARAVGTGFSGGIDSFTTIYEHFERPAPAGFKLTHLFFLAEERGVNLRREVNCLDLFRARMMNGRLHTFIRTNPFLKRLAKKFFK